MQVIMPTLPAQIFHVLRRQMLRPMRKPLIVMTPKSLLRHKNSISSLEDIIHGKFHNVIGEADKKASKQVKRVLACSGKLYFELEKEKQKRNINDIAIVRIEQLYPFPAEEFRHELDLYPNATEVMWCQEEPRNQGAWHYVMKRLLDCMRKEQTISYATRPPSASPAVGYLHKHIEQQERVINEALTFN